MTPEAREVRLAVDVDPVFAERFRKLAETNARSAAGEMRLALKAWVEAADKDQRP